MTIRIPHLGLRGWHLPRPCWAFCLALTFLALALGAPGRSQQSQPLAESIAETARNAREQKLDSRVPPKIITNDDLGVQNLVVSASSLPPVSPSIIPAESVKPQAGECDNPDAERVKTELLSAQEELDQIHRELSYQPTVISDNDVDLKNFKTSSSGLNVGAPPVPQTQPLAPAQITEVTLEEKISSLKKALTIACDSRADAEVQKKLDSSEQELHLLQNELSLDQAAYYSKPDYVGDAAGKARLDAEQQRIQDLESEIQHLKDQLAAPDTNQIVR